MTREIKGIKREEATKDNDSNYDVRTKDRMKKHKMKSYHEIS